MNRKSDREGTHPEDERVEDARLCSLHHKWLKELFVVIRGNGDPKHGIEWKVQKLLDNQAVVLKIMWGVLAFIAIKVGTPIFEAFVRIIKG